jgi:hypothetical protein
LGFGGLPLPVYRRSSEEARRPAVEVGETTTEPEAARALSEPGGGGFPVGGECARADPNGLVLGGRGDRGRQRWAGGGSGGVAVLCQEVTT